MAVSCSAYFITLTYNNDNCPICVDKRDCQLFLKRFRKLLEPHRIRFFLVSEYGEDFGRPHYHFILFNYPFGMFQLREDLKKSWQLCDPFWFDKYKTVQLCCPAAINYVAKYCLANLDDPDPIDRTFMLCSRRPGIGACYLTPQMLAYLRDRCDGFTKFKGRNFLLPRFYENKIFNTPELKTTLKENRDVYHMDDSDYVERIASEYNIDFRRALRIYEEQKRDFDRRIRKKLKNGKNDVKNHLYNNRRQKAEEERIRREILSRYYE